MTSRFEVPTVDTASETGSSHDESAAFLRGFIGSAVLLLTIRAAEPLFFGEGYFSTLTYHPFWIVVLLAAVQHGLFVGVATVGVATLMMDWPPRPVGMDITAHYVDMAMTPAQWLMVALLVGLYRQAQIRSDQQVRRDKAVLVDINDTLTSEIYRLDAALARAELSAATRAEAEGTSEPLSPRDALDALAHLSDTAADLPEAFIAAARACSDAEIAWLEPSTTGEFVLAAATHTEIEVPTPVSLQKLSGSNSRPDVFSPGEGLASANRHALCLLVSLAGAPEPIGAVIAFADSADDLTGLTSTVTLLARALEAAAARLYLELPPTPRLHSATASEKRAPFHG